MNIRGLELDPLVAVSDPNKVLLNKLLAVPALRERYLSYVHDIADKWLDWNRLGPIAEQYHALIADEVARDTRKLDSTEAFEESLTAPDAPPATTGGPGTPDGPGGPGPGGPGPGGFGGPGGPGGPGGRHISLKSFADQRRAYLLKYQPPKQP